MAATSLQRVLRRDRLVVLGALVALTSIAWAYVIRLAAAMAMPEQAMVMAGMVMAPAFEGWTARDAAVMGLMWAVMMVGMMLPSVAPMLLIHARVARQALGSGKPFAATGWFAGGYLLAWIGASMIATAAQWALERALLLSAATMRADQAVGGALLILAGLYQWTPLKDACLAQCQAPLLFIQRHGGLRRTPAGSLRLGARHGLYCIGCCWPLMALLFVGGVMNLLWIAAIAAFVLLEKSLPVGRALSRAAGAAAAAIGVWMALSEETVAARFTGAWSASPPSLILALGQETLILCPAVSEAGR